MKRTAMPKILALFLITIFLLAPVRSDAGCWSQCYQDCGNGMVDGGGNGLCTSRCTRYCTDDSSKVYPRPVTVAPHIAKFGAIAVSPKTLNAAYSYNFNSQAEAEADALKRCTNDTPGKPTDCKINLWFSDSCAAMALKKNADGSGSWATALGGSRTKAEGAALSECTKQGIEGCQIIGSFCSP